jgi:hypothetical protein
MVCLVVEEPVPNAHKHVTNKILEPTNTYQLRGRNVLPKYGQPTLKVVCEGSWDKVRMEAMSEEVIAITYPSVATGDSNRPDYPSQEQTGGQHDCLAQSVHTTNYTPQSAINVVRPILQAPQQRRTPRDGQESARPILTTTTSDRTVDVARGALDHLLSFSPGSHNEGDSQTFCIPARPQLHTHIPGSAQDLNATLAQFRTHFQQVFEFVQAPLNKLQGRATGLEQELYRRQSETMRLGRYAAWMIMDVENIIDAVAEIEVDTTAIEELLVEISRAAQKRTEEKMRLHTRVKGLEKNLKALQNIVLNIASPC